MIQTGWPVTFPPETFLKEKYLLRMLLLINGENEHESLNWNPHLLSYNIGCSPRLDKAVLDGARSDQTIIVDFNLANSAETVSARSTL